MNIVDDRGVANGLKKYLDIFLIIIFNQSNAINADGQRPEGKQAKGPEFTRWNPIGGVMINKLEHIGIVVKDLRQSLRPYQDLLGLELEEIEELDVQGATTKVAFLPLGEVSVELVESSARSGLVADFIRDKGEGIHHLAFEVDDLDKIFDELSQKGIAFEWGKIISGSRGSRVAFFKAEEFNGVHIELIQKH